VTTNRARILFLPQLVLCVVSVNCIHPPNWDYAQIMLFIDNCSISFAVASGEAL
jgi:hypothetical protein